jgi:hypothetical protein
MLRSPDFYEAVTEFEYLRASANAAYQMFLDQTDCSRCEQEFKFMKGVCDAFFAKVKTVDQEVLDKIKEWLSKRKGYAVSPVVLYYRSSSLQGRIKPFKF